jgi:ABC-type nitrate/sulfonate/bicarbonate transport system permease component
MSLSRGREGGALRALGGRWTGVALIFALLAAWELVAVNGIVRSPFFPPVSKVFATWFELVSTGELTRELASSLQRMFIGYGLAAAVGVVIGVVMGYFRPVFNLLEPLVELLRPIPSPAYIPMAILFLGIGDEMKIFMVFMATVFPILLNTYAGVRAVDPVQINTGRTFGLSSGQILREIILPASSPFVFAGLRVSLAIGLIVAIIAEMVAANNGIGFFILASQRSFLVRDMYAGVFTLALTGYVMNRLLVLIEGRLLSWHMHSAGRQAR